LGDTTFIPETKREAQKLEFNIKKGKTALSNLPDDESLFPVSLWVKETLRDRVQIISLNSERMKKPCPAYGRKLEFASNGSNLPLVIRDFETLYPDIYKDWIKHLQIFLYDLKGIRIVEREEDRHLYIKAKFKNSYRIEIPSWLLSDGTLRMIALTLLAYLPYKDYIFH